MPVFIPADNTAGYSTQKVTLDGVVYSVELRWNGRMGKWVANLLTSTGTPIVMGMPVLSSATLMRQLRAYPLMPPNTMTAFDKTGKYRDPDEDTFGVDVELTYGGS